MKVKVITDPVDYIRENVPEEELLAMAAEEATEYAQALLKLRRAVTGDNPTPKSVKECFDDMVEEWVDMEIAHYVAFGKLDEVVFLDKYRIPTNMANRIVTEKTNRWVERVAERVESDAF